MAIRKFLIILVRKISLLLLCLFILSIVVFLLARFSPGDPLLAYFGESIERMTEAQKNAAEHTLGLDRSVFSQYFIWIRNVFIGDWGLSYQYKKAVTEVIGQFWFNTLLLGGISYLLTFIFSSLIGINFAIRQGKLSDRIMRKIGTVTSVIPEFFVSLLFILFFAVNLNFLPIGGAYSVGNGGVTDRIIHLILPVSVMVVSHLWYYSYMIRNKMIEELASDYVDLLRIKGVSNSHIIWKHCFRNILPSVLTMMLIALPHFIGGTYIVEIVYSYPGLGLLSFESAMYHDYNMLSALCLLTGGVVLLFSIFGETISKSADPRVRSQAMLSFIDHKREIKEYV